MGIWAVVVIAVLPIVKGIQFLANSPRLRGRRERAIGVTGGLAAAVLAFLFLLPLPYSTVAEGVVIVPDRAEVRAKTEGFITQVLAAPGRLLRRANRSSTLEDPTLDARVAVIEAQLDETKQRLEGVRQVDRVQAEMLQDQADHLSGKLSDFSQPSARSHRAHAASRTFRHGRCARPASEDLLNAANSWATVIADSDLVVRTVASTIRGRLDPPAHHRVEARVVEDLGRPIPALILREVPVRSRTCRALPSRPRAAVPSPRPDPRRSGPQALFSLFQLDVQLLNPVRMLGQGSRVYVAILPRRMSRSRSGSCAASAVSSSGSFRV